MGPTPGWYPDPYGAAALRWWDGARWTQHLTAAAGAGAAAAAAGPAAPPLRRPLPESTPVSTPWIWLVTLLPLAQLLPLFAYHPFDGYVLTISGSGPEPSIPDPLTMMGGPWYLLATLLSWLLYAALVVFAWLDHRELTRRGVDRPFHWAWTFLAWPVYTIGRTVIVRRVAPGRGSAPLTVTILVLVTTVIATIVAVTLMVSELLAGIPTMMTVGA